MASHAVSISNTREIKSKARGFDGAGATLLLVLAWSLACYLPMGCAGASGGIASTEQANQAATSTGAVAPAFFGMVVRNAAHQPTVAAGSERLWDAGVTWAALEPARGSFVWSNLDAEVAAAQSSGVEVTLTLGMTPAWASSQPGAASGYGAGATAMPANLADWDQYVTAVATRYKGRIAGYEVWNAPSDATYWSGAAAQVGSDMALLAEHAAAAVRAVDTTATMIGPALDAAGMGQFVAARGAASVDVLSTSLSLAGQAPEAMVAELAAIRNALLNTSAETKPLWNDQPSWKLAAAQPGAPAARPGAPAAQPGAPAAQPGAAAAGLSDADQAGYAARALVLNASFGVARLSWYAWDESDAGVLRLSDSNAQPTAAAAAYAVMEGWLSGAQVNGCSANAQQVWSCQLVRNGAPGWIVWSAAGTVQASSMGMSTVTDLLGDQQAAGTSGWVTVGGSPVLLQ